MRDLLSTCFLSLRFELFHVLVELYIYIANKICEDDFLRPLLCACFRTLRLFTLHLFVLHYVTLHYVTLHLVHLITVMWLERREEMKGTARSLFFFFNFEKRFLCCTLYMDELYTCGGCGERRRRRRVLWAVEVCSFHFLIII